MGAVAITTLAGLVAAAQAASAGRCSLELRAVPARASRCSSGPPATWWIPLLLLLGVWRHVVRRYPLAYDPQYWGMVFPLGMYAAATFRLSEALPLAPLALVARGVLPVALAAWLAAALGLVRSWTRG